MSTRGCIARVGEHEGTFKGVYNHSDSYPGWMGPHLLGMLHGQFRDDLASMLRYIIDQHGAGWSSVGSECFCHPTSDRKPESPAFITGETLEADTDIEWLWVFDEENHRLYVRDHRHGSDAATIDLLGPEPDWLQIQCGDELERCSHYAYVHFPELKGTPMERLSTEAYLGKRELSFQDAIAFIIKGKRYSATGSGGRGDYLNRTGKSWPSNAWISSVKNGRGQRLDFPVATILSEGYEPYPGVTWVLPPTKDNPVETLREA